MSRITQKPPEIPVLRVSLKYPRLLMQKGKRLVVFSMIKAKNEAVDNSNSIKAIKSAWTIWDQSHRQQMTLGVSFPPRR